MQCNSGIQTKNPDILLLNHKISPNESEFLLCQVAQQDELRRGLAAAKEEAARAEADLVEARREIEVSPTQLVLVFMILFLYLSVVFHHKYRSCKYEKHSREIEVRPCLKLFRPTVSNNLDTSLFRRVKLFCLRWALAWSRRRGR